MDTRVVDDIATRAETSGGGRFAQAFRGRLHGLDAMRALAVLGMVYMHVSPTGWLGALPFADMPASLAWVESVVSGRAMSLFLLMAGVSVGLMTGGSTPLAGELLRTARRRLAIRASVLFLISLLVDQFTGINLSPCCSQGWRSED